MSQDMSAYRAQLQMERFREAALYAEQAARFKTDSDRPTIRRGLHLLFNDAAKAAEHRGHEARGYGHFAWEAAHNATECEKDAQAVIGLFAQAKDGAITAIDFRREIRAMADKVLDAPRHEVKLSERDRAKLGLKL